MNPLHWSFRFRNLLGCLLCVALLGIALYCEHVLGMVPCPLCVFQRIPFIVLGVLFLLAAVHNPRGGGRWVYAVLLGLVAAAGAAVSLRHLWIQSLPPDQVPSCGPNLGYMLDSFPIAKVLKMVLTGSGECAKVESLFGLPLPAWALLWFILLAVWALLPVRRGR